MAEVAEKVQGRSASDLSDVFLSMVPPNIVLAAAEGQMLGLIFFSLLFGYFMTRIDKASGDMLNRFWQGVADVMMGITDLIMKFAPLGVFGLVAKTVAGIGPEQLDDLAVSLGSFTLSVLLALLVHVLVTLPVLLVLVARDRGIPSVQSSKGSICVLGLCVSLILISASLNMSVVLQSPMAGS